MILLNLGAGPNKMDGVINLDINAEYEPEVVHDLEITPLPFGDESIHGIYASHILEHITNFVPLREELLRILVPGGILDLHVPHYLSPDAWGDPTHVRCFSEQSFYNTFWPGWTLIELNPLEAIKKYTFEKCKHLHAQLVKDGGA